MNTNTNTAVAPVVALTLTIDNVAIAQFPASAVNLAGLVNLASLAGLTPVADTLASAVASTLPANETTSVTLPDATVQDLVNFLYSDERYTKRSSDSILKAFPEHTEEYLKNLTAEAVDLGAVRSSIGRYGATYYTARWAPKDVGLRVAQAAEAPAETVAESTTAAEAPTETTAYTALNLVEFLTSDSRYTMRSMEAIERKFGLSADALVDVAEQANYVESVEDAKVFYRATDAGRAALAADTAPQSETAATNSISDIDDEQVLAFLSDNPSFRYRTVAAVAKHFDVSQLEIGARLEDMHDDGLVNRRTRRSDGARLFGAN